MADTKAFSDGRVDVIVIRQNQLTDPSAPAASEINTNGVNASLAIAWDGTTWPNNTDSTDTDDRSIKDVGNAVTRGDAQFEAVLSLFRPKDITNVTDDYGKAFAFFERAADRVPVYLITRVLQTNPNVIVPVVEGDLVSVFKMDTDTFTDDTEGDDSFKYAVNFNPQGGVYPYTQVVGASKNAITVTAPAGLPTAAGQKKALRAVLNGKRMTNQVEWKSSNPAVATVSNNGVVVGVSVGTANITATHPAGNVSTAQAVTIA